MSLLRSLLLAAVLLALAPSAASACDLIVTAPRDVNRLEDGAARMSAWVGAA